MGNVRMFMVISSLRNHLPLAEFLDPPLKTPLPHEKRWKVPRYKLMGIYTRNTNFPDIGRVDAIFLGLNLY